MISDAELDSDECSEYHISFLGYCTILAKDRKEAWNKFYEMINQVDINVIDERIELY